MRFESWSKTDVGLVRESNQDRVGCFPDLGLYVVADGMGGHADGEIASTMAVDVLREAYAREDDTQPGRTLTPRQGRSLLERLGFGGGRRDGEKARLAEAERVRLASAVQEANRRIFQRGHEDGGPALRTMGTTIIAVSLSEWTGRIVWAHVGDSRLYRLRDGRLELLTADHTRFGEPYRGGGTVPLDLPHTNQLTSALGVSPDVEVASGSAEIAPGDVFLLASDGVSGLVPAPLITQILGMPSADQAGQELLQRALAAGGTDNASVVVVRVLDR
jgi:serine/threonine protein phosphatase PrpC